MFPINQCQKIKIAQGFIYLGPSNERQSVGYLELNPKTSLTLHTRPAVEKLTQVKGKCDMIVFDGGNKPVNVGGRIVLLNEEGKLVMKPDTLHIHSNPYDEKSLTYWDFDGDIREIIEAIRK